MRPIDSGGGERRSCEWPQACRGLRRAVMLLAVLHAVVLFWPVDASLDGLHVRRVTVCDDSELSLRCPTDTVVDVMNAFYGRNQPSSVICPYLHSLDNVPPRFNEDTRCELAIARTVVRQRCQERRSCDFRVASLTFGTDPCPVTGKYLLVSYRCMPVKFARNLSCEGATVDLQCERSKRLFVDAVFYGWNSAIPSKCQLSSPGQQLSDVAPCSSTSASFQVKRRCSGRRTCLFETADTVLGHTCPGRHKFLDISYVCLPKGILVSSWRGPNTTDLSAAVHTHTSQNDHPGAITSAVFRPLASGGTNVELPKVAAVLDGHSLTGSAELHGVMLASAAPGLNQVTGSGPVGLTASSVNTLCNDTELRHANHRHGSAYGDDDLVMGWVHTLKYIQDNTEKMVLYGALCGCLALLLAMLLAIGRLLHARRRRGKGCGDRHRRFLARGVHHCRAEDEDEEYDDDDSDRRKLNVSSNVGPLSADHSNEENTYVPAADPSDIAGLTAFGLSLAAGSSGLGGGSSRSDDVFHRHDPRHTYYENDDGTGGGAGSATGGDRTCTNSFYDRHS